MLCQDPFVRGGDAYPCGRCHPCLVRRREIWKHRIMMECFCHSHCAFVTLTYADPERQHSLVPRDATLFLKKLRKEMPIVKDPVSGTYEQMKIRYYLVGEYGDKNGGAHFHLILFGFQTCLRGRTFITSERPTCCSVCDMVRRCWGNGHVFLGDVTPKSVGYVVDYVTKNMRRTDDERLKGRWPEFSRMSLRPGIGYGALHEVADVILRVSEHREFKDVPTGAEIGGSLKPYGRYLRRKLRALIGREEAAPKDENGRYVGMKDEEMQALFEVAFNNTPKGKKTSEFFKELLVEAGSQKVLNMKARAAITKAKRVL